MLFDKHFFVKSITFVGLVSDGDHPSSSLWPSPKKFAKFMFSNSSPPCPWPGPWPWKPPGRPRKPPLSPPNPPGRSLQPPKPPATTTHVYCECYRKLESGCGVAQSVVNRSTEREVLGSTPSKVWLFYGWLFWKPHPSYFLFLLLIIINVAKLFDIKYFLWNWYLDDLDNHHFRHQNYQGAVSSLHLPHLRHLLKKNVFVISF